jgi:hypothetical protein
MKKYICMPMTRWRMPGGAWSATSFFSVLSASVHEIC